MIRFLSIALTLNLLLFSGLYADTPIPQEDYEVLAYSSDNANHPVAHAFDADPASWWALYNDAGFSLPGIVELDLGGSYDVSGFVYTPNPANAGTRAIGYEVYLSADGEDWGAAERVGEFSWADAADVSAQEVLIGAVAARYVKLVYSSSQDASGNVHTGDLYFYESDLAATGQSNQSIALEPVGRKYASDEPITLQATATSGLDVSFSVLSGPATVSGNTLSLTGAGGIVEVLAEQEGDSDYYPVSASLQFEVIDLNTIYPTVSTRLTEDYALEMPIAYEYPIYIQSAIEEEEVLRISNVELEIGSETHIASKAKGYHYFLWRPEEFGEHQILIRAIASNGNETTIARTVNVTNEFADQTVTTLEDVVIEFGGTNSRWYSGTYSMPQHVGAYDQIIAYLEVECPDNDCDDWDRQAYFDVMGPDGNWMQIIRYITPYRVACSHELDVTDYASLLQGEFEFRVFIDTWGTGGWQLTLNFEYREGTPEYRYSAVDEIWDGTWDLGNPTNLQPMDTVSYTFPEEVSRADLRISNTGHGWGENNTQNAAEFYPATNYIEVSGFRFFTQNLWNDCNPNPDNCTNQAGTWEYNRAGWCPGAIAPPDVVSMDNFLGAGTVDLAYIFDPSYTDFCHPNNPDCNSGFTCPDCNDGYKAIYLIDVQMINRSNTPLLQAIEPVSVIDNTAQYDLQLYPNPSSDLLQVSSPNLEGSSRVSIHRISGEVLKTYFFNSAADLNAFVFDISDFPSGAYFMNVENNSGTGCEKFIVGSSSK